MKNQTAEEIAREYKKLNDNWLNQYIQLAYIRPFEQLKVHVKAIHTYGALAEVWHNVSKISKANREYFEGEYYENREPLD